MNIPDAAAVLAYVCKHPNVTCAEIAREIDAPSVMVSASLRALRAAGKLRSEGNTKATRWSRAPKKR